MADTPQGGSGWTIDTLREYLVRRLDDEHALTAEQVGNLRDLLQERYATQTKALDAAFVAAEKEVRTALASAEKAVTKSEDAYRSKFADVNEFRKTLSDQAAGFLSRDAAEARFGALDQKIDAKFDGLSEKLDGLAARMDKNEGRSTGINAGWVILVGAIGVIATAYAMFKGG